MFSYISVGKLQFYLTSLLNLHSQLRVKIVFQKRQTVIICVGLSWLYFVAVQAATLYWQRRAAVLRPTHEHEHTVSRHEQISVNMWGCTLATCYSHPDSLLITLTATSHQEGKNSICQLPHRISVLKAVCCHSQFLVNVSGCQKEIGL